MVSPLEGYELLVVDEAISTQDLAFQELINPASRVGAVMARHQIGGRGRFKREWITPPGEALTFSMILRAQAGHAQMHLLGMAAAVAAASSLRAKVQWPNDVVLQKRKLGGILTEIYNDREGRKVAIVGIGINLNQAEFPPEIEARAISLKQATGQSYEPEAVLKSILQRWEGLPEIGEWTDLAPVWEVFDQTNGKRYTLPSGNVVTAIGIGGNGELLASDEGTPVKVLAADALLGAGPA